MKYRVFESPLVIFIHIARKVICYKSLPHRTSCLLVTRLSRRCRLKGNRCHHTVDEWQLHFAHPFPGVNHVVPRWVLLTQTPAVCQCFRLHAPSAAVLCRSSEVKPPQVGPHSTDGKRAEEPEEPEGPEYIPKKKAKNPMMNIGYAW